MYQLYIANKNYSSWSLRPWVLMRAQGIAFTEHQVPFGNLPGQPDFGSFSPTASVPVLVDGELTVWDSMSIVEYLAERHQGVWPADPAARAWARSAAAEMHSSFRNLRNICGMSCGVRVGLNEVPAGLKADIARVGELWNQGLDRFGGPFLAGETFTAVDAFFAPVIFRAQTYALDFGGRSGDYVALMLEQPAMREWYDAALAETWRDQPHEDEVLAVGTITLDMRARA
ncbi:glutathione S-transferase family protein [Aminobacter sp. AP02]|uniref:glutathione S-transferase family protein n=1 Tax=Aminobacter sp. AP02 TaxID=2135737 RepID=UPI000D6C1BDA|nr:glutathione S-transferase family protein [Aminobacter sp. AP02]PWK75621.1 glutathione S-transferase [Aminobacter sp. AP02]